MAVNSSKKRHTAYSTLHILPTEIHSASMSAVKNILERTKIVPVDIFDEHNCVYKQDDSTNEKKRKFSKFHTICLNIFNWRILVV